MSFLAKTRTLSHFERQAVPPSLDAAYYQSRASCSRLVAAPIDVQPAKSRNWRGEKLIARPELEGRLLIGVLGDRPKIGIAGTERAQGPHRDKFGSRRQRAILRVIVSGGFTIAKGPAISPELAQPMAECTSRLEPKLAKRIAVIHHADEAPSRHQKTATGRDRRSQIARMMQAADRDHGVERIFGKRTIENTALDGPARQPALLQAVVDHGDGICRDIETSEIGAAFRDLLRDAAVAEPDFEHALAAHAFPINQSLDIRIEPKKVFVVASQRIHRGVGDAPGARRRRAAQLVPERCI